MLNPTTIKNLLSGKQKGVTANLIRFGLWCLTPFYAFAVRRRNRRFNSEDNVKKIPVPVISIGNLTTGGTGKTPAVIWFANRVKSLGKRPVLLSRGYGRGLEAKNDEAIELEDRLPNITHLQNPDRVASAEVAVNQHAAEFVILDDGFQHRKLSRDLDVVLIDATNPFGYENLIPRGLLREPLSSLSRAEIAILTRHNHVDETTRSQIKKRVIAENPNILWAESRIRSSHWIDVSNQTFDLEHLSQMSAFSTCAIGNPGAFMAELQKLNINVIGQQDFPDHHRFNSDDLVELTAAAKTCRADCIVCTHKDMVKIRKIRNQELPIFALITDFEIVIGCDSIESQLAKLIE